MATDSLIAFLFLLCLGYLMGRLRILNRVHVDGVLRYVQFVAIPMMVLVTITQIQGITFLWAPLLVYYLPTVGLFLVTFLVGRHGLHLSPKNSGVLAFGGTFSNLILLGLPIIHLFFDDNQMLSFFLILSVHALVLQTVMLLSQAYSQSVSSEKFWKKIWRMFKASPIIGALLLAHILREIGLHLPSFFLQAGEMLAVSISGGALISIGVLLSGFRLTNFLYSSSISVLIKLCIHPLLVFSVGVWVGLPSQELKLLTLMAALPSGILTAIVSRTYSASSGFSSSIVSFSGALSMLSLSIVIYWLFG